MLQETGREVVFWGADAGEQTWREMTITEQFARSMALEDAMNPDNLLVYEMNGEPLPPLNGFPVRLIAPGWYGIANVKWLTRIEVLRPPLPGALHGPRLRHHPRGGARRRDGLDLHLGRARPPQVRAGQGDENRATGYSIMGAAWGAPIAGVEVRIDEEPWQPATLTDRARARSSPGRSGPSTGVHPPPASTRSPRARSPTMATSNRRRTTLSGRQDDLLGEQRPDHPARPNPLIHMSRFGAINRQPSSP